MCVSLFIKKVEHYKAKVILMYYLFIKPKTFYFIYFYLFIYLFFINTYSTWYS